MLTRAYTYIRCNNGGEHNFYAMYVPIYIHRYSSFSGTPASARLIAQSLLLWLTAWLSQMGWIHMYITVSPAWCRVGDN